MNFISRRILSFPRRKRPPDFFVAVMARCVTLMGFESVVDFGINIL